MREEDGRRRRSLRTKANMLEAALLIIEETGNWRPANVAVAKRAGYTMRSFFQRFGSVETFYEELIEAHPERLAGLLAFPSSTPGVVQANALGVALIGQAAISSPRPTLQAAVAHAARRLNPLIPAITDISQL